MPRSLDRLGKILHLIASSAIIFALAYFLGYTLLNGPLRGSDSALHLGYARWLDTFLPRVPHWYPLQGGGQSLLHGYPLLAHLLLIGVQHLSGLSLLQAFRLISFAAFPLSALGIYFYGWIVFRNQTVGLIASIFYLAAPITWTWMYDWGFFPQHVAFVFLTPALIAFDQTLSHLTNQSPSRLKWIWFAGLVSLVVLATFTHMLVATAIAAAMGLYTLFAALVGPDRSTTLRRGLTLTVLTGLVVGGLAAFYLVPFYAYRESGGPQHPGASSITPAAPTRVLRPASYQSARNSHADAIPAGRHALRHPRHCIGVHLHPEKFSGIAESPDLDVDRNRSDDLRSHA